ncbi:MAG: hypothetical protein EHM13_05535 [Acidobacteria bacterium]|nr:MAG: hypothetical protein EHM13_05535 [Acidobacteriota bacterium]
MAKSRCSSTWAWSSACRDDQTAGFEFEPDVTDDKRYLFFSRSADFTRVDVYWVRFDDLLETLKAGRASRLARWRLPFPMPRARR